MFKVIKLTGMVFLMVTLVRCGQTSKNQSEQASGIYKSVWEDQFDGTELDLEKWTPVVGNGCPDNCQFGNNELQFYSDSSQNLAVSNGTLKMIAFKEAREGSEYTSAKLISQSKGDWKYGKVEVKAKLPTGRGTWPAIWMLPTLERPMNWPLDGEIDIMEHVGYNQGMIYGTIHTLNYNHIDGTQKSDSIYLEDVSDHFHVYSMEWDEQQMSWFVDGKQYLRIDKGQEAYEGWPFDQKFHLILNFAVGGNWGGKYGVDDSIWPQIFEIDYVKVYQKQ